MLSSHVFDIKNFYTIERLTFILSILVKYPDLPYLSIYSMYIHGSIDNSLVTRDRIAMFPFDEVILCSTIFSYHELYMRKVIVSNVIQTYKITFAGRWVLWCLERGY